MGDKFKPWRQRKSKKRFSESRSDYHKKIMSYRSPFEMRNEAEDRQKYNEFWSDNCWQEDQI